MPICGYLVIADAGAAPAVAERLAGLPGCEVVAARNRDLLLLVTETDSPAADRALRDRIEASEGIHALFLTFGEIDPETFQADPLREGRTGSRRRLPVRGSSAPGGPSASGSPSATDSP